MQKIIVVKQGGIGDVIVATPILAELKRIYPKSYITLMIYYNALDVVTGLPFVDEVFPYDKKKDGYWKLFRKMRGNDLAIFLDLSYRPAMLAALARVPLRVGLEHKRKFWLNRPVKWRQEMDHIYEPQALAGILEEGLGLKLSRSALEKLYIAQADEGEIGELRGKLQGAGLDFGKYVACSPVTAYFLKNWPLEKWNELFVRLYKEQGLRTVVFGSKRPDFPWDREAVADLHEQLNLRQAGHLIKEARLMVNGSSMPEHMAAAMGTPCVLLYGYSEPERWAPRQNCLRVQTELSCAPCDGYHGSTCKDPRCMREMTVERVYQACCRMLEKKA